VTERRPHVVHVSSVHQAGDPRIRLKQLKAVVDAGWRATLVTGDLDAKRGDEVEIVTVPPGRARRLRRMLVTAPRAMLAARRLRADLYHIHDPELLAWTWLLTGTGKPVVYDIHEDNVLNLAQKRYLPRLLRRPIASLLGGVENILAAPLRQIIAERAYRRRFPRAVEILNYAAVNLPLAQPAFDPTSMALLYTGNLTEHRGPVAMAELARDNPDLEVTTIGFTPDGIAERMMRTAGGGKLTVVGKGHYIPAAEIRAACRRPWLAALALFSDAPHNREKELTKFYEYMAAGLPIIASNFPVWRALIEANGVGICVPPGDAKAAAEAARWLKVHPEEGRAMAERGQELVATRFNWDAEAVRLIDFYRSLMGDQPGA
jgi:glycosyltransferase involved in cell wall biosynthesis